ncbi:MAG: hypothetical protein M1495_16870 [Bacteroidetes bacterium]|nr:hypothetical protein [Bacteroidota bacterium]
MKTLRLILTGSVIFLGLILTGCDHFHDSYDTTPPSPPTNLRTITGDNRVDIYWDKNPERDVAGYNVYYAYSYNGKYTLIGTTQNTYFVDNGATNGTTYYYAVTAFDFNGNESDLSKDVIYDTPRPEGFNQAIFDYNKVPDNAGYNFKNYLVVPYNDAGADMFFENYNGQYYLDVWKDSDIQDMGQTTDIYDISTAPAGGWVPLQTGDNIKYTKAIVGHTYVIWTNDNHYAKVRISSISSDRMIFDWAYQTVEGNRELKRGSISFDRKNMPTRVIKNY